MIPLPDLLYARPHAVVDEEFMRELLEMAFLGSNESREIDKGIAEIPVPESSWKAEFFVDDLYVERFVDAFSTPWFEGRAWPLHTPFLLRALTRPPIDADTIAFRQGILRELEADRTLRYSIVTLYTKLVNLLDQLKSTHTMTLLDATPLRLDTLRQLQGVVA